MKPAFAYSFDQLEMLAMAWESGISPQLAQTFIDDGLLISNPPHYELTDAGKSLLDSYGMYRPFQVQCKYSNAGWEDKGRYTSLSTAAGFVQRLQSIKFLTPRSFRILDASGRVVWDGSIS